MERNPNRLVRHLARAVVNGNDCAMDIANYVEKLLSSMSHTFAAQIAAG
jgi:hypothetical protein